MFECLGHGVVQRETASARDRVIEGGLDEAVVKAVAVGVLRGRADQAQPHRLVEQLQQLDRRRVRRRGQGPRAELLADHRGDAQHLATLGREHGQARGDGVAHARRQWHRPGGHRRVVQALLGLDEAEQLRHEQRIAAGELVDAVHQRVGRGPVAAALDHAPHVGARAGP